jgi:hypothetical protein
MQCLGTQIRLVPGHWIGEIGPKAGQFQNRNRIAEEAASLTDRFVCVQDRTAIHLYPDNLRKAVEALEADPRLGGAALSRHEPTDESTHLSLCCIVWRREVLAKLRWDLKWTQCSCDFIRGQVAAMNYDLRFVDFVKRIYDPS